jgi:hypothetical protein
VEGRITTGPAVRWGCYDMGSVTGTERRGWRCGCWQRSMKLILRIEV